MSLNRYIKLKRGDRDSVIEMMKNCEKTLGEGNSIMMFPEGTRSPTGQMRAFKPGAFEIALKTGRPVLPIAIEGTSNALPKRGFVLRGRHPIRITVLEEIPVASFENGSVEQLVAHAREAIAKHLTRTQAV
jgi:1-acyl-sn-glycerol-3-phosphate acyltransferase